MKTLQDLIKELSNLQKLEDKTLAILKLFLYSEYYALKLCKNNGIENKYLYKCEKCGYITGDRPLSLTEKITKLIDNNIIDEDLLKPFDILNKLRNRLMHDISPKYQTIIKWIQEYEPPTNEAVKELLKKEDEWTAFYLCLVPAIANLYREIDGTSFHLESIEYNKPTGQWIFHLN